MAAPRRAYQSPSWHAVARLAYSYVYSSRRPWLPQRERAPPLLACPLNDARMIPG